MIREATLQDYDAIHHLIEVLKQTTFSKEDMYPIFEKTILSQDYKYYVYIINNEIVGFISLLLKTTLHHTSLTAEILELVVEDAYRNQKIGEQLLSYIEQVSKDLHVTELELSSNMKRKDAHRFYEKHQYIKDHYNFTKLI